MDRVPARSAPGVEVCPVCGGEVGNLKCKQVCRRCGALVSNCNGD